MFTQVAKFGKQSCDPSTHSLTSYKWENQSHLLKGSRFTPFSVLQESKEVVLSWVPAGAARLASQLSSTVPLEPSLNSNTQAVNLHGFSDSSQKARPSPPSGFLTDWPNEVRISNSCLLRKGSEFWNGLQENRFPLDVLTLSFTTL